MIESPDVLFRLRDMVDKGSMLVGVFDRSLIKRSIALELIDLLIESLPDEIEEARAIVANEKEILEKAQEQAGEIIDEAVRRAEKLVDGDAITAQARIRSGELKIETDRYITERLTSLEKELLRLLKEVQGGLKELGGQKVPEDSDFNLDKL